MSLDELTTRPSELMRRICTSVTRLESVVNAATVQIADALSKIRSFLEETEEHLKVDLCCLCCLGPLLDPQVCCHEAHPPAHPSTHPSAWLRRP